MKNLLLIIILFFVSLVYGQNAKFFGLRGYIYDNVTRTQLVNTKVELLSASDSSVVDSARASFSILDYKGEWHASSLYRLRIPFEKKNYILRCIKDGYKTTYQNVTIDKLYKRELTRNLPPVYMKKLNLNELKGITVTATKVKFYNKGDTVVYNADAFQLSEGSMLDALVRQLPGAELKKDGRIYVNGKFVQSLLLNGKDFFRGNNQVMLDNLPTYTVNQVKVYDKTGEKSEFVGRNVGDNQYVMDINLKKQYSVGWIGNLEAGGGTEKRYLGRLFAMRFTNHSRVGVYANINNLNDSRKPGENDNWTVSDLTGGETKQQIAGIDYSLDPRNGLTRINGNIQYERTDNHLISNTERTNFLNGGNTFDRILSDQRDKDWSVTTDHRFTYQKDRIKINVYPSFRYRKYDYTNSFSSITLKNNFSSISREQIDSLFTPALGSGLLQQAINRNLQEGLLRGDKMSGNISAGSTIKMKHSADFIDISLSGEYRNEKQDRFNHYNTEYYTSDNSIKDFRNQYFNNKPDKGYNYKAGVSYNYFVNGDLSFTFDYQYSKLYTSKNSSLYRLDRLAGWDNAGSHLLGQLPSVQEYESLMDNSNSFDSRQYDDYHRFGVACLIMKSLRKSSFTLKVVLPFEMKFRQLRYRRGSVNTRFSKRTFVSGIGGFSDSYFQWGTKDGKYQIFYQFSVEPTLPDMTSFVDVRDDTDPLNITLGNPDLKTSYTSYNKIGLTRNVSEKQQQYSFGARYNITWKALSMGYMYDKQSGVRTFKPANVNGNWNGDVNFSFLSPVDKKRLLNFSSVTTVYYNHNVDLISVKGLQSSDRSIVKTMNLKEMIKLDYKIKTSTIGLRLGGTWINTTGNRDDFSTINATNINYGLTAQLNLPWKLQLSTDLTMYSRRGYNDKSMNTDDLVWNTRLSRSFCKGWFIVMVDGFDILGNLNNVTRTLNAQARTEVYTNVLPSYVMFHAVYRFNVMPKKKK